MLWADIVRILAIYLIVVIHVSTIHPSITTDFTILAEFALIHTCVPLFVMLSGALLLGKKESYQTFFKKRLIRVFLPWITWTSIFTIISVISQNQYSVLNILHTFHTIFFPLFWFLPMIFALYLLTPALRIFVQHAKKREIFFLILLWYFGTSIIPYVRDTAAFPLLVDNGILRQLVEYFGYFLLGFYLIKLPLKKKHFRTLIMLFIGGIFFTIGMHYLKLQGVSNIKGDFFDYRAPGIILITASLFGMIFLAENYVKRHLNVPSKKAIVVLSNTSFGIYFIHYLFLNRAPLPTLLPSTHIITISPAVDLFINGIIIFALSFVLIFCLQQIHGVKRFIG